MKIILLTRLIFCTGELRNELQGFTNSTIFSDYILSSKKHFRVSFQARIPANLVQNLIQPIVPLLLVSSINYQTEIFFAAVEHVFEWNFWIFIQLNTELPHPQSYLNFHLCEIWRFHPGRSSKLYTGQLLWSCGHIHIYTGMTSLIYFQM